MQSVAQPPCPYPLPPALPQTPFLGLAAILANQITENPIE